MPIAPYLKTIGRGKDGARPLTREQAEELMGLILAGQVSDLELGAFAIAMRIKGETADELDGFVAATMAHTIALPQPDRPAVLLPSYNGARRLPNLTPLLALLLARHGVPVLVHGPLLDAGRVTSAEIFSSLDLPPVEDAAGVQARWQAGEPAFIATTTLNAPLARLLEVRRTLGLRNSGHIIAKVLPLLPGAVRVVNHTHPEYAGSLAEYLTRTRASAMLMRGTEGEPVADCRRLPRLEVYLDGQRSEALSIAPQDGPLERLPELPAAIDAATTAAHIRAILAGQVALPEPIARQIDTLRSMLQQMSARG